MEKTCSDSELGYASFTMSLGRWASTSICSMPCCFLFSCMHDVVHKYLPVVRKWPPTRKIPDPYLGKKRSADARILVAWSLVQKKKHLDPFLVWVPRLLDTEVPCKVVQVQPPSHMRTITSLEISHKEVRANSTFMPRWKFERSEILVTWSLVRINIAPQGNLDKTSVLLFLPIDLNPSLWQDGSHHASDAPAF